MQRGTILYFRECPAIRVRIQDRDSARHRTGVHSIGVAPRCRCTPSACTPVPSAARCTPSACTPVPSARLRRAPQCPVHAFGVHPVPSARRCTPSACTSVLSAARCTPSACTLLTPGGAIYSIYSIFLPHPYIVQKYCFQSL